MRRRDVLLLLLAGPGRALAGYEPVREGVRLVFPRDHGAHPGFRIEWWYVTGWIAPAGGHGGDLGFQITFFRVNPDVAAQNPSRFAPRQILFAHAALADPAQGRLVAGSRSAREGFGLAEARQERTRVWIGDWSLEQWAGGYRARVATEAFALDLRLETTQPILLHGEQGYSRKAAEPRNASFYYSQPQLRVLGSLARAGRSAQVSGLAWLDHEWSSELLPAGAVGWDWVGLNLADGSALMAFRLRDGSGASLWAGGTLRAREGAVRVLAPGEVGFAPLSLWRSPRSGGEYPAGMSLRIPGHALELRPLMEDQELDARASTGGFYWEGAVRAFEAGREIGRGYLELTGYAGALRL
ncbi:MAG: lipocalin-like domain-containing protein [Rhodocyclaceae bacterium]